MHASQNWYGKSHARQLEKYANGGYDGIHRDPDLHAPEILALLPDDDYRGFVKWADEDPERGDIIKGGGGVRKVRYAAKGHGKRGGIRVIYYWLRNDGQIYMLLAYPKSEKDDLTDKETALFRDFVKDVLNRGQSTVWRFSTKFAGS